MGSLRLLRGSLDGAPGGRLRILRGSLDAPPGKRLRILRGAVEGAGALVIRPIATQTVEPETIVTLAAVLEEGVADTWTWRVVSTTPGPAPALATPSAGVCTLRAPSAMPPGATVVIGVTATIDGRTSTERTVTVAVLPQVRWWYDNGTWRGSRPLVWLH